MTSTSPLESVGEKFDIETFFKARIQAIDATQSIASQFEPGMQEKDALNLANAYLKSIGSEKLWHPTKVRFGQNTIKSFREISEPDICLQKEDIFFIDIGPVFSDHEADYGKTFVQGSRQEYKEIAAAAQTIFEQSKQHWAEHKSSGMELYRFVESLCSDLGYTLNLKMNGHRLSDFPHHLHYSGSLIDIENRAAKNLWVLEILIQSPDKKFGAFFEDLLI